MINKLLCTLFFLISLNSVGQEKKHIFVGKTLELQKPISGVHIYNLNRLTATASRDNGIFEITVSQNDTLIISHVKYKTQRIVISKGYLNNAAPVNIHLEIMTNYLDTVSIKNHDLSGILEADSKTTKLTDTDSINAVWRDLAKQPSFKDYERDLSKPILNNVDATVNSTVKVAAGIPMKFKDVEIRRELKNKRDFPKRIISDFGTGYFTNTLKIPSEKIHHFLTYCDSKNIIDLYYKNEIMAVLTILHDESIEYTKIKD